MKIFVRHCFASSNSESKARPPGFDRTQLFHALLKNTNDAGELTVMLDTHSRKNTNDKHFTESSAKIKLVLFDGGSDSSAFRHLMNHISERASKENWSDETIVVCLEDDFDVSVGWPALVREGLSFAPYVTLYDHPDKYSAMYAGVPSQVFCGRLSHWRTTPSTVNSFATHWKTLREDMEEHLESCDERSTVTRDHSRFLTLWNKGRALVSCIPGRWSHEEQNMQSPFFHNKIGS